MIDGADSPATSSTEIAIRDSARPTAGLLSWTTTRTSARSSRVSRAASSVGRSSSWAQITASAPASPASARVSADRELPAMCGMPQPVRLRASRGSGWSSMTTVGTPEELSSSTIRRPTPCRPQTITCPRHPAYVLLTSWILTCADVLDVNDMSAQEDSLEGMRPADGRP